MTAEQAHTAQISQCKEIMLIDFCGKYGEAYLQLATSTSLNRTALLETSSSPIDSNKKSINIGSPV